jgi:hypothetical protein
MTTGHHADDLRKQLIADAGLRLVGEIRSKHERRRMILYDLSSSAVDR